jgi:hypothetical protein
MDPLNVKKCRAESLKHHVAAVNVQDLVFGSLRQFLSDGSFSHYAGPQCLRRREPVA